MYYNVMGERRRGDRSVCARPGNDYVARRRLIGRGAGYVCQHNRRIRPRGKPAGERDHVDARAPRGPADGLTLSMNGCNDDDDDDAYHHAGAAAHRRAGLRRAHGITVPQHRYDNYRTHSARRRRAIYT